MAVRERGARSGLNWCRGGSAGHVMNPLFNQGSAVRDSSTLDPRRASGAVSRNAATLTCAVWTRSRPVPQPLRASLTPATDPLLICTTQLVIAVAGVYREQGRLSKVHAGNGAFLAAVKHHTDIARACRTAQLEGS